MEELALDSELAWAKQYDGPGRHDPALLESPAGARLADLPPARTD